MVLSSAPELYDIPELNKKALDLKEKIIRYSFNGQFFVDNMVRENGQLKSSCECTEVCQYYAFFCGVADKKSFPALWDILVNDFGPERIKNNVYPEIYPANAFIGNYLRLEILFKDKLYDQVLSEIKKYFYYMAKKTGTLWENTGDYASCNHGFASHVIYWIENIRKYRN